MVKAPDEISGVRALCELKDQCRLLQLWFLPFPNILPAIARMTLTTDGSGSLVIVTSFPAPTNDSSTERIKNGMGRRCEAVKTYLMRETPDITLACSCKNL